MVQESNLISKVCIVGGGPAGCFCAYFLQNDFDVTVFDKDEPLKTLLPTGGGKCNLCHAEYDFMELAKNYPRGEKFLYSVFSKFSVSETLEIFKKMGIKTYTRDDGRIFPVSNSSKDVRNKFLKSLDKVKFIKKEVTGLDFESFDYIVLAVGGHSHFEFIPNHTLVEQKPALVGLKTKEKYPQGVSIQGVKGLGYCDDILFTHEGISGPLIYKISSIKARDNFPYVIKLSLCEDFDLQKELDENPHKSIKNVISNHIPRSLAEYILKKINIEPETESCKINGKNRDEIKNIIQNFEIDVIGASKGSEVVTCGGISLDEINSKTMQSKIYPRLYFCGEMIDIDGFCGGFNLQNCWSTAYVAAEGIKSDKLEQDN